MEDKQIKKIKRYLDDAIDERNEILLSTEKLISTASQQVQALLNVHSTLGQKEAVLRYLAKSVALFSELNFSVLQFLESESLPFQTENVQNSKELQSRDLKSPDIHNVSNIVKPSDCFAQTSFNSSTNESLTVAENVVQNTTSSVINVQDSNSEVLIKKEELEHKPNSTSNHISPPFSLIGESEVSSVAYQHPLTKFQVPPNLPKSYDTEELDKIKQNLKYLSKKMGFDSDQFGKIQSHYHKSVPMPNFEYEEPVREFQENIGESNPGGTEDVSNCQEIIIDSTCNNKNETNPENNVIIPNSTEVCNKETDITTSNQELLNNIPSTSTTGTIKKQQMPAQPIEFSSSSDSENVDRINSWLNNNKVSLETADSNSVLKNLKVSEISAVDKLHSVKRYDRNEDAREQARKDMPDIKFVSVEVPKVIKNNLILNPSSSETITEVQQKKAASSYQKTTVYELKEMEPLSAGAICVFSHIVSPSEFYLQVVNDLYSPYLDEISNKLEERLNKSKPVFQCKQDAFERLGKFCYGYIWGDKKGWFRLKVLDWKLGLPTPEIEVQAVDYGFKCRTSYEYLREMFMDIAHIPMLAVQCHFPLLYPPGSIFSVRLTDWPQETIHSLYEITNLSNDNDFSDVNIYEVMFSEPLGESIAVDLIKFGEPNGDSVGKVLIDFGLAVEIFDNYDDNPEIGEFLDDITDLENPENLNELVLGYDAKDEERICRFTRKDGTCYKGRNCKLEHITLKDGYTTDKQTTFYTTINDPIYPSKGDIVQVLVTAYVDSCSYLVQMVRNPVVREDTNITMDRDMADLIDAMNHPKKISDYKHFKVYPAVGEIILAYSAITKVWVRGAVRELNYDNIGNLSFIEVYAVDFGDLFTVKLKDTRVMIEDFMRVPIQVIPIYLDKYQYRRGCDANKARKFFVKHIFYRNFLMHVRSEGGPPFKVNLTTFKSREIGQTLVSQGFAEKRSMDLYISEESKMDLE